jgi:hypothetical protein
MFFEPDPDRQLPSFHQQSTTTSPLKHHVQPPVFAKTPTKNRVPPSPKNCCKTSPPQAGFGPLGDDYNANHSVLILEIEDLGAAQLAPILRLRENGPRKSQIQGDEVSPENTASPKILILWGFSRVFAAAKADSNHARTVWRRVGDSLQYRKNRGKIDMFLI